MTIARNFFAKDGTIVPCDPVPSGRTASDVTSTTAVEVIAATASKRMFITKVIIANKTASEPVAINIQDDAGTPVVHASILAQAQVHIEVEFDPPLEIAAGQALDAAAAAATGDTLVTALGYVEQ